MADIVVRSVFQEAQSKVDSQKTAPAPAADPFDSFAAEAVRGPKPAATLPVVAAAPAPAPAPAPAVVEKVQVEEVGVVADKKGAAQTKKPGAMKATKAAISFDDFDTWEEPAEKEEVIIEQVPKTREERAAYVSST